MTDNAKADFVISDEDMEILKKVPCLKTYGNHDFFPGIIKYPFWQSCNRQQNK